MNPPAATFIDLYCERTSADFWAEPLNAVSNLSFIVAALAITLLLWRPGTRAGLPAIFLCLNVAAIGVGSFLFHTFADRLTMLADLLPIFIYQLAFLAFYARWVAGRSALAVGGLLLLFMLTNLAFGQLPPEWLNGSLLYGGALVFTGGIAAYHHAAGKREPAILYLALAILAVSLACRTLDQWICEWLPLGTHFLWHLLNGMVLYLTTRAYVINQPAA